MKNHDHHKLIQKLLNCVLICENCASECLDEPNVADMVLCIKLDHDCADLCMQAARLLQRGSEISHEYLVLCEDICRLCAAECGKHQHQHCQQCAEACVVCADACHDHHHAFNQA
jgi:hypothetical protein